MKNIILYFIVFILLTACSKNNQETEKENHNKEITTEITTTNIDKKAIYNKFEKIKEDAEKNNNNAEVTNKISAILEKLKSENLTSEEVEEYETELNELYELLEPEIDNNQENELLKESDNVIVVKDSNNAYYRLDRENNSIIVFNSRNEILNTLNISEDEENYTVFVDSKNNKFILKENSNGNLQLEDSLGTITELFYLD